MVQLRGTITSVRRSTARKTHTGTLSRPVIGGKSIPFVAPMKMDLQKGDKVIYEVPVEMVKQIRTTKTLPRYWGNRKVKVLRKLRG